LTNHGGFGVGWQHEKRLTDIDLPDGIALIVENEQEMTTQLDVSGELVGLHVSREKSKSKNIKTNHKNNGQAICIYREDGAGIIMWINSRI